jgi:structural maintenance of chromosome 4
LLHQLANEEVTKAEVMKAAAEKNVVRYTSGVKTNHAALEEVEKELEDLKDQLAEVAQYLDDLKEKLEAAQAAQESSKDDLDQLKQQLQEKQEEIDEFRKKEVGYLLCDWYLGTHYFCSLKSPRSLPTRRKSLLKMSAYLTTGGRNMTNLSFMKSSEPLSINYFNFRMLTATCSDDDDDDEEEEEEEEVADQVIGASGSGERAVKQEHADSAPPKKVRQRTPSTELYIYSRQQNCCNVCMNLIILAISLQGFLL